MGFGSGTGLGHKDSDGDCNLASRPRPRPSSPGGSALAFDVGTTSLPGLVWPAFRTLQTLLGFQAQALKPVQTLP